MNFKTIALMFALTTVSSVFAQTKSDVFNPDTEITWLGLDFTGAKFIGDRERLGSTSDIRHLLDAINELMVKEADKYNVAAALKRKQVQNAIEVTMEHNNVLLRRRVDSV
jgi:hypothetical protein